MNKAVLSIAIIILFVSAIPAEAATNYCPKLSLAMQRGARDAKFGGQVSELQKFLSAYYSIASADIVTGYFGPTTQRYLQQFQREQGLVSAGYAGPLTRAAVAKLCIAKQVKTNTTQTNSGSVGGSGGGGGGGGGGGAGASAGGTTPAAPKSVLTADQLQVGAPSETTVYVGNRVTFTYTVGANILSSDPASIERLVVPAGEDTVVNGLGPALNGAGTYTFDWIPQNIGSYEALLKINLNGVQYTARSAKVTVINIPILPGDTTPPPLSCTLTTDSNSYLQGGNVTLFWGSQSATSLSFVQETGKNHLSLPTGTLSTGGSYTTTASAIGEITTTMVAYNNSGSSTCSVMITVGSY